MKRRWTAGLMILTIFCICIVITVLFGCGKKDTEDTEKKAKGKYVEQIIDLPVQDGEKGVSLMQKAKGGFKIYTCLSEEKIYRAYESSDGTNYEECSADWLNSAVGGQEHYMKDIIAGKDGAEYALYIVGNELHLIKSEDGENAEEVLPELFRDKISIDTIRVQENGDIIVCSNTDGKTEIYDAADGSKLHSLEQGASSVSDIKTFDYKNGKAVTLNKGNDGFYIYDTEQEKVQQEISYGDKVNDGGLLSFGTEDDCYYLNGRGLYHMSNSGSTVEMLMDGAGASMGDQSKTAVAIEAGTDQDCYALYNQDGGGVILAHYVYDKDAKAFSDKQLTIYGIDDNKTIRQAVTRFQAAHPDVQVNFKTGSQGEGATSKADQIRVLNTELLSGNGADILVLDGMPVNSYIEKGVLEDMTEFYEKISKDDGLLANVTDSMKKDGKLYSMPARIKVLSVYGAQEQTDAIEGLDSLDTFLESGSGDLLTPTSYEQYLRLLTTINYKGIFEDGRKTSIDEGELKKLLETTKRLSDAMGVDAGTMMEFYMSRMPGKSEKAIREEMGDDVFESLSTNNDMEARTRNQAVVVEAGGTADLMLPCAVIQELGVLPQGVNGLYIPSGMVGINSGSKNKELAEEFLELLFSEEVQALDLGDGFPVNRGAIDTWCSKKVSEDEGMIVGIEDENGNIFSAEEPAGEQIRAFAEIGEAADTPVQIDDAILEMIIDEGVSYYKGEKSVEDAVSAITNKAKTYLAE